MKDLTDVLHVQVGWEGTSIGTDDRAAALYLCWMHLHWAGGEER